MTKYIAVLNRSVEMQVDFEDIAGRTRPKLAVTTTLLAGPRQFRSVTQAKNWVASMNKDYGTDCATYIGKQ